MTIAVLPALLAAALTAVLLDAAVRPRAGRPWRRSGRGRVLAAGVGAGAFGLFLAACGSPALAAALAVAVLAVLTVASNAKHAALGEPLLFSDFALVGAVLRHPGFYLTAVPPSHKAAGLAAALALGLAVALGFVPAPAPHGAGGAIALAAGGLLRLALGSAPYAAIARVPDAAGDVARHGLVATLLLYWWRWRATPDPAPCPAGKAPTGCGPELVLIVQCESFADPAALFGEGAPALPGLMRARARAEMWGDLHVSGFGAYTMRTEYGVLWGRSEAALGFRRYDPFLTAAGEASHALPARLAAAGYRSIFAHPHSLRFYRRDRLMPAAGFARVIGAGGFPPAPPGARYLGDPAFGAALCALADESAGPTLIYAVTMENHGPWLAGRPPGSPGGRDAYLAHLRSSDAMLAGLIDHLDAAGRPALLAFFGDHRPSIPGTLEPGAERHTPYAMLRFPRDEGAPGVRADLTPDALHAAILRAVPGGGG